MLWVIAITVIGQVSTKKAIYIIMDGIPTDIIHKASTPNLDRIENEGVFLNSYVGGERGGYSQPPTISAYGYAALVTGTWALKNGTIVFLHPIITIPAFSNLIKMHILMEK